MNILVLDNYDSYTFNLVQYIEELSGKRPQVFKNDQISVEKVGNFDKIVLSPGPGLPATSGVLLPLLQRWASEKSILGVCLGMQAIGEAFGGQLEQLSQVWHGVATSMYVLDSSSSIFKGIPSNFEAGRYHSWVVQRATLPSVLQVTCEDEWGNIMALQHCCYDVSGVQFHPESILTPMGRQMLENWLRQ